MRLFGFTFGRAEQSPTEPERATVRHTIATGRAGLHRNFKAGVTDRLTQSWTTADETVNQALRNNLRTMRARSRDWARNNEYGRKFFSQVVTNVVGHAGFTLKVDARRPDGSPDLSDSARVLAAYRRWCRAGQFDVTGRLTENQFDALAMRMIARDGEVLIRLVEGSDRGIHHCQLQLLPAHLLDEEHNRELSGGRRIRMGVEFDAFMKPVAYHLRVATGMQDMHGASGRQYERIDAREIIHLFIAEEVDQWRGTPWPAVALRASRHLNQFDEAALIAANVGAAKMGFFQQKDPEAGAPISSEADGDGEGYGSDPREFVNEATPGTFDIIPDGYELVDYNPTYPNEVYDPFTKNVLRRLSTGLLTTYHGLTGDLTQVNFSSIRAGTLDERETWKMFQSWYIEMKKVPVFEWWLGLAMLFDADLRALPYSKFDKFNAPVFTGRRWDWVDPRSDVLAAKEAVSLRIKSRAQLIRDFGRDPEEVWAELADEDARGFVVNNGQQQPAVDPA